MCNMCYIVHVYEREPMKKKRIVLENTALFHDEIKSKAALRGLTMKDYINMAILAQMKRDQQ